MAKIAARGAGEKVALNAESKSNPEYQYRYVLCTDGRVLIRGRNPVSGFTLLGKLPAGQREETNLREIIRRHGRQVI